MRPLLSLLGMILVVPAPAASPPPSPSWDHAGYDAEDSYYNPRETAVNPATVTSLHRRWSATLRTPTEPSCAQGQALPLVTGGRVFVADRLGIAAYRADTGAALWTHTWLDPTDTGVPLMGVSGNRLITATASCMSQSDPNGSLTGLDVTTGWVAWQHDTDIPLNSLAVDKGVAAVSGASPSDALATRAFATTDGHQAWTKPGFASSGVSANGTLLLTHGATTVAAAITTGAVRWTKPGAWTAQAATPASDRFLATSGTTLAALNTYDGSVAWTAPGKAGDLIAADGQRVYRASDRTVEALTAWTGRRTWTRQLPSTATQPVVAGGLVYAGSRVLNAATGVVAAAIPGSEVVTGGVLYAISGSTLSAYTP
jgi:outer membrane protein assembly factor BamB